MIKDYLNTIISNMCSFYENLNLIGVIIFYTVLFIIIVLIILLGVIEKRRRLELETKQTKNETPLPIKDSIKEDVTLNENDNYPDIVEDIASRNIIDSDIKNTTSEEIDSNILLTKFEEEQEQNSIISYEELISKVDPKVSSSKEEETIKKFNTSPLLSPVYGIQEETVVKKIPSSNIKPVKANEEFLKALKELRDNLD